MYLPEHFRESRIDVLHAFVEQHPLATLVSNTAQGLTANHLPLLWQVADDGSRRLRGHVARGNPLWRQVERAAPVLAIFTGAQHYISPSWYPSKREDGRVVPTWNYATVHVHGTIQFIDDAAWLRAFVETLTDTHEPHTGERWRVSDAPATYLEGMLRAIVGLEIHVSQIEGKFKASQNRSEADRAGVASALTALNLSIVEISELVR